MRLWLTDLGSLEYGDRRLPVRTTASGQSDVLDRNSRIEPHCSNVSSASEFENRILTRMMVPKAFLDNYLDILQFM